MNNSTDSSGFLASNDIGGFGYGIGISIGILILILTIFFTSYFCTRIHQPSSAPSNRRIRSTTTHEPHDDHDHDRVHVVDLGIDEDTIKSYPKLLYSEAKLKKKKDCSASTCCSICLGDYKSSDVLRVLPDCEHLFHVKCIDPWLRLHPTCPVCRTSPIPTPLSTPLAEVIPLATQRD